MKYVEAFNALGYQVDAPRADWSAEKADGICITIWNKEKNVSDGLPYLDLWELHPEGGDFTKKPGHKKRTKHLQRAKSEFDGRVDVIFVSGDPLKGSYENASPWFPQERKKHWHISKFCPETGFFRAEIQM